MPHLTLVQRPVRQGELFDSELSGPQIARERFVSHKTLRGHTKHIATSSTSPAGGAAVLRAR